MTMRNKVKWATSKYLYNYTGKCGDFTCHRSFSTEDDGLEGVYNPRFMDGKQVTRTPALNKAVVSDVVFDHINNVGFYDPWYAVENVWCDFDENDNAVHLVTIKNKLTNKVTKWAKGSRKNSVWKQVK